jgi:hypothetical protein
MGVLVEGVVAGEGFEIAVHVPEHEPDEEEPAEGHQDLQGDGRVGGSGVFDEAWFYV